MDVKELSEQSLHGWHLHSAFSTKFTCVYRLKLPTLFCLYLFGVAWRETLERYFTRILLSFQFSPTNVEKSGTYFPAFHNEHFYDDPYITL